MNINLKNRKTQILLVTLLILIVATIGAVILLNMPSKTISVPDFSTMNVEEIDTWISDNKLDNTQYEIVHEYSDDIEEGKVISQSIEKDTALGKDAKLIITISDGYDLEKEVEVPDFKDKKEEEIKKWFEDNHFTDVTFEYESNEDYAKNVFIKSNIKSAKIKRNTVVLITISVGEEEIGVEIDMPDLSGYTKENIQAWAKTNKMTVSFAYASSSTIAVGKVISQNPKANTKTTTGSKVVITLSTGKGIDVESFAGKTKTEAQTWIKNNGLKGSYIDNYSNTYENGVIISNTPATGSIAAGSTVTFNVSVGKPSIDNYVGKTQDDFTGYINRLNNSNNQTANIKLEVLTEESSSKAGTILKQSVTGTVDVGTKVTITVAAAKTISVPSYAGKAESELKSFLSSNDLLVGSRATKYHDSYASGSIISNDTGSKQQGTSINYTVSLGSYSPDAGLYANNKNYNSLVNAINSANNSGAGWSVSQTQQYSETVASGNIINCSVSSKKISCNVSKGKEPVKITVPNYVGAPKPCSTNSCTANQLKISMSYESSYNNNVPKDVVVSQSVAAGSKVDENTTVKVVISKGPQPCPAGSSGTYPNCDCGDKDYDAGSNSCVAKTTGTIPRNQLSTYTGSSVANCISLVTSTFNGAGFTNLNFIIISGADNPNDYNAVVKSIDPAPETPNIPFTQQINIEIYSRE